jgi:hypothetical protein
MFSKPVMIVFLGLSWSIQAFADFSKEEFLSILTTGDYVLISADRNMKNPADAALSDEDIADRTLKLEKQMKKEKFKFHKITGLNYALDKSYFVAINKKNENFFLELGEDNFQESIIVGSHGLQKLVYTYGRDQGLAHEGTGVEIIETEKGTKDFYTEMITTDGIKVQFKLNFNFDKKCLNELQEYNICPAR